MVQGDGVEGRVDSSSRKQCGKRRSKAKTAVFLSIIQRLNANSVTDDHDPSAIPLPYRKCEHSLELTDTAAPPCVVGLQDDFGVTFGEELVPFARKLGP